MEALAGETGTGPDIRQSGIFCCDGPKSRTKRRLFSVYQKLPADITMTGALEDDP
ncbi:MAG: hypothetical protein WAV72_31090 [Bradyrhizobium sp.]